MQPIYSSSVQSNLAVVVPNLETLEDSVVFDPTNERFVLRNDADPSQETYIKGNQIRDVFHNYLTAHINEINPETVGHIFSNLDQRITKMEEPMRGLKGIWKSFAYSFSNSKVDSLMHWSEQRNFLYAIQNIVKERMGHFSLTPAELTQRSVSPAGLEESSLELASSPPPTPSLPLVSDRGSDGSSPESVASDFIPADERSDTSSPVPAESEPGSPERVKVLSEENRRLQAEIESLRRQMLSGLTGEEAMHGPVRKPFQHTAAQLWVGCITDELRKFDKPALTDAEKIDLYKVLSELGISEFEGRGNVYRVKAFRSSEADVKTEAYCLRKLQNWLQNQEKLLINPDVAEGFTQLTDREMDSYLVDPKKTAQSNEVAKRYGLPQRNTLRDVGFALWRAKALELAARHKLFNDLDLTNMKEKFYKTELAKAQQAQEEVYQSNQEKSAWNPTVAVPAAATPEKRSLSSIPVTPIGPPKPPPPPPPAPPKR